jgi:beta-lactamase class A
MISQSDNTAADTLIDVLGREKIEKLLPALGIAAPARLRPLLQTREVVLLKAGPDQGLAARWTAGSEPERRRMLNDLKPVPASKADIGKLMAAPVSIDTIEWFASASDLIRVMAWLKANADPQALEILAINPGIAPNLAGEFAFVGYKGGSETGVVNMTLLLKGRKGDWHALSGTWNDKTNAVDEARFVQIMSRAVALLR